MIRDGQETFTLNISSKNMKGAIYSR